MEEDFQRRRILQAQVIQELGVHSYENYDEIRAEVDARLRKEKME